MEMSKQEETLGAFAQSRRDFIVDGLKRFGEHEVNPFSGSTYGDMLRVFNDFHPDFKIELKEE